MTSKKSTPKNMTGSSPDEQIFRRIFDGTSAVMLLIEPETGEILNANQAAADFYGYPNSKLCNMSIGEINTLSPEQVAAERKRALVEERNYFIFPHRLASGQERIVKVHSSPITLQDKQALFLVIHDVTERKQADERLRESEEKHRTFIEQSSECITLVDEQGTIVEWNHAREVLTGLNREGVLGKPYWDIRLQLLPPKMRTADVLQRFKSATLEMLQTGQSPLFNRIHEGELVTASGERKFVDQIAFPIKTKNGYCIGSVLSDSTARKQAEEALKQSEAHYHLLADHMTDKIWLMDMNLKLTYASPSVEKRRGYTFEELQRLPLEQNLTPASFEMVMKVFAEESPKVMADPSYSLDRTLELEFCQKDGSTFWEENKLSIIRNENGTAVSILGEGRDITERKLVEERLRKSEEKYRLIAENTSDGIIIFGADNHIQYGSPAYANQLGYSEMGEFARTPETIYSVIHPDDREAVFADIYKAIELKKSELTYSHRVRHRAGHYIWREDNARFNYDLSGNYCGANVICRDITERKQAEESIRQRVMELGTLNRISLTLRAVAKQEEMLSIVLDEALAILNTSHGSIELHNKTTDCLDQTIMRGWLAKVNAPHPISEGIAGKVFSNAETYITREFASDPETRAAARSQIPPGWGGICLPIRTSLQTLGVLIVCVPSERELNQDEVRLLSTLSEMTGSALQRMQLHEQTVRRLEQLHSLRAVDQAIASNLDMRLTLDILIDHTVSQLGVDAVAVLLLPPGMNLLELAAHRGFHTHLFNSTSLSESFSLQAIVAHRLISANEFEVVNKNQRFGELWKKEGFACYWCVPLNVKGEIKGVLEVYCRMDFTPDAEWFELLEALASQAAIAIDNTQLFENLQRANLDLSLAYDATIEGWSRAMDLRDHETEGHTLRVTDLTLKLARAMRISESQLTAIRRGALLHDIGKMGVPDAILLKEGDLTDEEWRLMRQHPQLAHDMLAPIAYLKDALDIPYWHHEKWDGTGYPQGLKGDHIPLVARLFAIVDVWDALTNDRSYRKKWTKQKARQYIKEQSGRHFDPQVVDAFLKIVENDE